MIIPGDYRLGGDGWLCTSCRVLMWFAYIWYMYMLALTKPSLLNF